MEYDAPLKSKDLNFSKYSFVVDGSHSEEYGELVAMTAKLLKRPYGQIHRIFTKEKWSIDEIRSAYVNATKHNGQLPSDVFWWWKRKQRCGHTC